MSTAGTLYDKTVFRGYAKLLATSPPISGSTTSVAFVAALADTNYHTFIFDVDLMFNSVNAILCSRVSNDSGASWLGTGSYHWTVAYQTSSNPTPTTAYGSTNLGGASLTNFGFSIDLLGANYSVKGQYYLCLRDSTNDAASAGVKNHMWRMNNYCAQAGVGHVTTIGGGGNSSLAIINGLLFYPNTGLFIGGNIKCYGIRQGGA